MMGAVYSDEVPDLVEWLSIVGELTIDGERMGRCAMRYPLNTRYHDTDIWCNGELVALIYPEQSQGVHDGIYEADHRDDEGDEVHIEVRIESMLYCRQIDKEEESI